VSGVLPESYAYVNKLRQRFTGLQMRDVSTLFSRLRLIKTDYERKMLEESARISGEAHKAGMKTAGPGVWEYEVQAAMEYTFKKSGAIGWGYPSIVASGPNATTLHYEASTRQMKNGELLLVDAAANYNYLTTDITRTYPVNGKFTSAQKDIYELVLRAQEEAAKVAVAGTRIRDVHRKTVEVISDGLKKLGLITDTKGDQYAVWYTHSASHWIGLDVHDAGDRNAVLADGMAFTIEPGIYIRQEALDNLPKTPENQEFIRKVQSEFEKYKDIGVRIEDSYILTDGRAKQISTGIPKTVEEIEKFMKFR
jgi:Xaa-Pro aminopeptidase